MMLNALCEGKPISFTGVEPKISTARKVTSFPDDINNGNAKIPALKLAQVFSPILKPDEFGSISATGTPHSDKSTPRSWTNSPRSDVASYPDQSAGNIPRSESSTPRNKGKKAISVNDPSSNPGTSNRAASAEIVVARRRSITIVPGVFKLFSPNLMDLQTNHKRAKKKRSSGIYSSQDPAKLEVDSRRQSF